MVISPILPLAAVGLQAASQLAGQLTDAGGFLDLFRDKGEENVEELELSLKIGDEEFTSIAGISSADESPAAPGTRADSITEILKKIADRLQAAGIPGDGEIEIEFSEDGDFRVSADSTNGIDVTNVLHFDEKLRQDIVNVLDGNRGVISRSSGGDWQLAGL